MICIDASVFVARTRSVEERYAVSRAFVSEVRAQDVLACAPVLVLPECTGAMARRTGKAGEGRALARFVRQLLGGRLVSLDLPLAQRAAQIAAQHRLRGADAVYVATAEQQACEVLITWDAEMIERGAVVTSTKTPAAWLEARRTEQK